MSKNAWLTVDDIPAAQTTRTITLPDSDAWLAILQGALSPLIDEANFEQFGTLTPAEMADEWFRIFNDFMQEPPMLIPPGLICPYGGASAPAGWLLCDGSEVSRTTYAALFAAIGTAWGSGDGTTTFELPPAAGRVMVGLDVTDADFNNLGDFGGQKEVNLEVSELPEHTHIQNAHTHVPDAHTHVQNAHNHVQNAHNHVQNAHTHVQDAHSHTQSWFNQPGGAGPFWDGGGAAWKPLAAVAGQISSVVATNQNTTPTNQNTTPTNQNTTPTNQSTTPTNQNTTPTNQNAGGGGSHNNLPPYMVANYIIKT